MRPILPAAGRGHLLAAKAMGATMWCWILWRLKHDWKDLVVCTHTGEFEEYVSMHCALRLLASDGSRILPAGYR